MSAEQKENTPTERPWAFAFALIVYILQFVLFVFYLIPFYDSHKVSQVWIAVTFSALLYIIFKFILHLFDEQGIKGLFYIAVGFFWLYTFTTNISDTILVAIGTAIIANGVGAINPPAFFKRLLAQVLDVCPYWKNNKKGK